MNTRDRGYRRYVKTRAIERAFDVYWNAWGWREDAFKHRGWYGYEKVILETVEERWAVEAEHKAETMLRAKATADNMCTCSCWVCTRRYEPSPYIRREMERDACDLQEVA
ncbi:MAG: hypothetical protein JSS66_05950 [Armatimonadetes bacterium]|nr:hypothetical protein [Armatimonadota bacterium]